MPVNIYFEIIYFKGYGLITTANASRSSVEGNCLSKVECVLFTSLHISLDYCLSANDGKNHVVKTYHHTDHSIRELQLSRSLDILIGADI